MVLAITCIVAALVSFMTLFSGFGLGTFLMPVIALFMPVGVAVAVTAVVHLFNNLFKLVLLYKNVDWPVLLRFGFPAVCAAVPGAMLLTELSKTEILFSYEFSGHGFEITSVKICIGILMFIFASAEFLSLAKKFDIAGKWMPFGGILSGFFGGVSGHQGALRSIFMLHAGLDKNKFVATNAAIASCVDVVRLIIYGISFSALSENVSVGFVGAICLSAFLGVYIGKQFLEKITIGWIQKVVAVMLYIISAGLIAGV